MKHCVFWAKLDSEFNPHDEISGNPIIPNTATSNMMTWDSVKGMWRFRLYDKYTTYSASCTGIDLKLKLINPSITRLYDAIVISNPASTAGNTTIPRAFGANFDFMDKNVRRKAAHSIYFDSSINSIVAIIYIDGVEQYRITSKDANITLTPEMLTGIGFTHGNSSGYMNSDCYQKNFMIFNKALTIDEIRKIQKI